MTTATKGQTVVRNDSPCQPGKVLEVAGTMALVDWDYSGMYGSKPQRERISDLSPAYVAAQ